VPLKEVDLKTVEAYKKAIRQDLPKLTSGDTRFWIYKDIELPDASGKASKLAVLLVLVDNKAVKPMLKKEPLCKGTCKLEDGKVAFEAEKGIIPYKQLKTSVPLFLGKMLHIPKNVNEDGEVIAGTDTPASTTTAQTTPTSQASSAATAPAGLAVTWNKLLKDMQTAVAAHPERREALSRAAAGIPDLIKENKAVEAQQRMTALQVLLDTPTATTQTAPTGANLGATWNQLVKDLQAAAAAHPERREALSRAAAGIPDLIKANKADEARQKMDALRALLDAPASTSTAASSAPPSSAELTSRWNGLVKQMQAAVAAHPDKKADIVRAAAGIPDMIRTGKLDLAAKLMDGVDAVLKATAAAPATEASPQAEKEEATAEQSAALKPDFDRRFAELDRRVQAALKAGAGDVSKIRTVSGYASEKGEAGDYATALKALDQLEELLETADKQGRTEEGVPQEGLLKYRRALYEFAKAKDKVAKQIAALKPAIVSNLPEEAGTADALTAELRSMNDELAAVVDEAMNAADDDESPVTGAVSAQITKYLADLRSDELIQEVDQGSFGVSMSIAQTLGDALQKIQQAMPATA